jgi:hypothetical protein
MHGAAVLICRAVTLGASKSVSFENKKLLVLNLKIVSKGVKKNLGGQVGPGWALLQVNTGMDAMACCVLVESYSVKSSSLYHLNIHSTSSPTHVLTQSRNECNSYFSRSQAV